MAAPQDESTVTGRVRSYRKRMRDRGMRPIQMWVADVRSPVFAAEARRQSATVAASQRAADNQSFIDGLSPDEE